ncbi:hypothetical protein H0H92_002398 [Tricholoma furcatifolium]|nr:hypothetical protein H0H92_002398 [Tricholoma furcatifolium]
MPLTSGSIGEQMILFTGPLFIGIIFNWGLLGAASLQTYVYFASEHKDRTWIRALDAEIVRAHKIFGIQVWLAGSASCDVIITVVMISIFYNVKSKLHFKNTNTMLDKLIVQVIECGAITTAVALVDMILMLVQPGNLLFMCFGIFLSKLTQNKDTNTGILGKSKRQPGTDQLKQCAHQHSPQRTP